MTAQDARRRPPKPQMALQKAPSRRQKKTSTRLRRLLSSRSSSTCTEDSSEPSSSPDTILRDEQEPEWLYEDFLRHRHGPDGFEIEVLWAGNWPHSVIRTWEGTRNLGAKRVAEYQKRLHQKKAALDVGVFNLSPRLAPLLLRAHQRIVVFSGAGISAAAGIPTFTSACDSALPDAHLRSAFTATKVDSPAFPIAASSLYSLCAGTSPTEFHHFLLSSKVCLHLTQNIDCLETSLPALEAKTVRLHGRVDTLRCTAVPGGHSFRRDAARDATCPRCTAERASRLQEGRRGGVVGTLQPDIRRYGDVGADALAPGDEAVVARVLAGGIDCLLVAGTALRIPAAERLVRRLCDAVRDNGGVAMWVNVEPPSRKTVAGLLDFMVLQSADDFARDAAAVLPAEAGMEL